METLVHEATDWKGEGALSGSPIVEVKTPYTLLFQARDVSDTLKITEDAIYINDELVDEIGPRGLDIIRRAMFKRWKP